jgi:HAD superfamily hydrolase (TIGR01509 family)
MCEQVPVALVTRNTTSSVNAFLDLIGPEWAGFFDPLLTREFAFVKPDKRLLLHVAQQWGVPPSSLLMVGDSFEDVEVGNAAGTATCLVAGGGNEKPGAVVQV